MTIITYNQKDVWANEDGSICHHCKGNATDFSKRGEYCQDGGFYKEVVEKINALPVDKGGIPDEGHSTNNDIDIFKCAQNTYYDIMNNGACNMNMKHRLSELYQVNTIFNTPILDITNKCFAETDNGHYVNDPDEYWDDLQHEAEHMMDVCIEKIDEKIYEETEA